MSAGDMSLEPARSYSTGLVTRARTAHSSSIVMVLQGVLVRQTHLEGAASNFPQPPRLQGSLPSAQQPASQLQPLTQAQPSTPPAPLPPSQEPPLPSLSAKPPPPHSGAPPQRLAALPQFLGVLLHLGPRLLPLGAVNRANQPLGPPVGSLLRLVGVSRLLGQARRHSQGLLRQGRMEVPWCPSSQASQQHLLGCPWVSRLHATDPSPPPLPPSPSSPSPPLHWPTLHVGVSSKPFSLSEPHLWSLSHGEDGGATTTPPPLPGGARQAGRS